MRFSERLKHAREKKGLTLSELGSKIGKTEATVQRYESGNIKNLKSDTIEKIANTLNISPQYLMGWSDEVTDDEIISDTLISAHHLIIDLIDELSEHGVLLTYDILEEMIKEQGEGTGFISKSIRNQLLLTPSRRRRVVEYILAQLKEQKKEKEAFLKLNKFSEDDYIVKNSLEDSEYVNIIVTGVFTAEKGVLEYDKTNPISWGNVYANEIPDNLKLCIQTIDDSLEPHFKNGEILYVVENKPFINKKIYVVEVGTETYIKKVYKHSNGFTLVSLNNDVDKDGKLLYPDIEVTDDDEFYIIGRVI